jgi:branched-chain amino acid transport system permease protein
MSTQTTLNGLVKNKTLIGIAAAVVVAILAAASSSFITLGQANQFTSMLLLMSLAMAWNLVGGFGGQFSLGHSIFVGIGGYATAILLTYFDTPLLPTVLAAGVISAFIGVLLAYPLLRLRGPYLSVGSLGMALAAYGWMINWDFTKASSSYNFPASASLDIKALYMLAIVLALVSLISIILLVRSPLGLRLVALRDDETGAASLGVRRVRTLIPVWALSGLLTGLMGAIAGLQRGNLTVDSAFAIQYSLDAAIICVLGGLGTLSGPLIGAVIVYYLRFYSADYANWALIVEAFIVIAVVRFFPGGIMGLASRFVVRWRVLAGKPPASLATEAVATIRTKNRKKVSK